MPNSKATFRPLNFKNLAHEDLATAVDAHLPRLFDMHASLNATAIKSPRFGAGFSLDSGNVIVTGSKLNNHTSLTKITQIVASVSTSGVPNAYTLSVDISPNNQATFDLYVFQPTAAGVTTPIAATAAVLVRWIATGTADTTT